MFENENDYNTLEESYIKEKKKISQKKDDIQHIKYQIKKENEKDYEKYLYFKRELNSSVDVDNKLTQILDEYQSEANQLLIKQENKIEYDENRIKQDYLKRTDQISRMKRMDDYAF